MRNARLFGIILLIPGIALTLFLIDMAKDAHSVMKILFAGPALVGMSLGMLIMPGKQLTREAWSVKENRVQSITEAPPGHRITWLVLAAAAVFGCMAWLGFL